MIQEIFLDLDDVLCTMSPHILHVAGCPVASDDYSFWPADIGFEIEAVADRILNCQLTREEFWASIPIHAWTTIPKTPYADWLIETCKGFVGQRNVYIATAPTDDPKCASGKMEWMQKNLPAWLHRQFAITPCKYLYGNPWSLLIDDYPANIRQFRRRQGHAITVPRPWNRFRGRDQKAHIDRQLRRFAK